MKILEVIEDKELRSALKSFRGQRSLDPIKDRPAITPLGFDPNPRRTSIQAKTIDYTTLSKEMTVAASDTNPTEYPIKTRSGTHTYVDLENGLQVSIVVTPNRQTVHYSIDRTNGQPFDSYGPDAPEKIFTNLNNSLPTNLEFKKPTRKWMTTNYLNNKSVNSVVENFWQIVNAADNIDLSTNSDGNKIKRTTTKQLVTRKRTQMRYYLGVASMIFIGVRFGLGNLLPRGGGEDGKSSFDLDRHGYTVGAGEEAYNYYLENQDWPPGKVYEHAVPAKVIVDTAIGMVKQGAKTRSDSNLFSENNKKLILEIAKMIRDNLIIVIVSQNEDKLLNNKYQYTMPGGWEPGKNLLARYTAVGIRVYDFNGNPLN